MIETELGKFRVGKSKLTTIIEATFDDTHPDELRYLRDRLYANLADTERLTWAKFVVFLSSFG
ncbi:MAG: hypothetical protein ACRD1Z_05390, partial [Vicinamibacteria bacterium]